MRVIRVSITALLLITIALLLIIYPKATIVVICTIMILFILCEFPYKIIVRIFRYITKANYASITLPFHDKYITVFKKGYTGDPDIRHRLHELDHVYYFRDKGAIIGSIIYLAYLVWYGYWNHPIEIRARKAAGQQ